MTMHLNFGRDGGAATFSIHDESGNLLPIGYQYDTRKGGFTGFTLPGVEGVMTWPALHARYPTWKAGDGAR